MASVFRDRAIAAQSSNDALDERVRVVPLRAWLAVGLAVMVMLIGALWMTAGTVAVTVIGSGTIVNAPTNVPITAGIDGTVIGAQLPIGTRVAKGDVITTIESGPEKLHVTVKSPVVGTVVGVGEGVGATVSADDYLATIAPDSDHQVAYLYVPDIAGGQIRPEMEVRLSPNSVNATDDGYLLGHVMTISPLPVPLSRIQYVLANEPLAASLAESGPVLEVLVSLDVDPEAPSGYVWSQPPGPSDPPVSGIPTGGKVVVSQVAPYRAFFTGQ